MIIPGKHHIAAMLVKHGSAIIDHYPSIKKGGYNDGGRLVVNPDDDDNPTIALIYDDGTVMVQVFLRETSPKSESPGEENPHKR